MTLNKTKNLKTLLLHILQISSGQLRHHITIKTQRKQTQANTTHHISSFLDETVAQITR